MSEREMNNTPVTVTGDERSRPAFQLLARACLALAELRCQNAPAEATSKPKAAPPAAVEEAQDA
jgi:hypothetical protein